jgi:acyl carrier protein
LNRSQRLAGIGERGEICFRSPHLARGYLADEELTQARFITNPFTQASGDRIYCTGDLGRYRPDGTIDYLGRNDYQVKIRGFRIEPGEIEATLRLHPAVREVVVMDRGIARGEPSPLTSQGGIQRQGPDLQDKILVAYVVLDQTDTDPTALKQQLTQFLRARLPSYMVPSVFMLLEALPLLPNRKVDRDALPPPTFTHVSETGADEGPRTATEERLARLWAEVLGLEQVGIHDNFFEIGGHSLLATQLIAHIAKTFKVTLPLRALFEAPTIANLALLLVQPNTQHGTPGQQPEVPLVSGMRYRGLAHRTTPSR